MAERPKARDRQAPELRSRPRPGGVGSTAGEPPDTSHPRRQQLFRLPCLTGLWFNMLHISSQANTWQGCVVGRPSVPSSPVLRPSSAPPRSSLNASGKYASAFTPWVWDIWSMPLFYVYPRTVRRVGLPVLHASSSTALYRVSAFLFVCLHASTTVSTGRYCFHLSCTYLSFNSL